MRVHRRSRDFLRKIGLAALAGFLSIFIFPLYDIELLAWVAFIPLLAAIHEESPQKAFWLGWIAGTIHFLGTLYWVTVTMVLYGSLSNFFSGVALLLLVGYLALYPGVFCCLFQALRQRTALPGVVLAPVLWVGLEYLRSFLLIGFPWNILGYSQYLTPYVTQIAEITGVYGVSFVIIIVNVSLYTLFLTPTPRPVKIKTAMVTLCCVGFCLFHSARVLSSAASVPAETSEAEEMTIAVVQGNIDQSIKWDREHRQQIFEIYSSLSRKTLEQHPDMIVWPETAVPFIFRYDPPHRQQLISLVQNWQTPLLFGGLDLTPAPPPQNYHSLNSAFFLSPEGRVLGKYDKIRLVPFGEYVPFEKILFFIDQITTAIGKVQAGDSYQVMQYKNIPFSTVICFEVIFPNLVRKFVDRGAQFLINITNDAWFGKTAASYQHFAMVTFRAIENRVPIARAANTGISGFIDPYGRILKQSDIFVEDAFVHTFPLQQTTTFYSRYGDVFARLCFITSLGWILYLWFITRKQQCV